MSTKFTPGPWRFSMYDPHGVHGVGMVVSDSDWLICDIVRDCHALEIPEDNRAESLANATLIAAAPEMYDECEALYSVYVFHRCPKCEITWSAEECNEMDLDMKAHCATCGYQHTFNIQIGAKARGES